jgi:predicted PurR-regulated permease PerM
VEKVPNAFQRHTLWTAITALSIAVIGGLVVGLIWLLTRLIAFLQPLLIPFAVAGVLAYLLEPAVEKLIAWKMKRHHAVMTVFLTATAVIVGIVLLVVPALVRQGSQFGDMLFGIPAHDGVPAQVGALHKARVALEKYAQDKNAKLKDWFGVDLLHWTAPGTDSSKAPVPPPVPPEPGTVPGAVPPAPTTPDPAAPAPLVSATVTAPGVATSGAPLADKVAVVSTPGTTLTASRMGDTVTMTTTQTPEDYITLQTLISGEWLAKTLPTVGSRLWLFISSSVGGFLGVFGFLLSLIIVPLYLYYFLIEGPKIGEEWSHYVPLRASKFKDEVVDTLTEINRYLIAFFRGQLVVSIINGVATGIGLQVVGLSFGWLIGLALCVLGIIPYLGIIVCWIPAVVIASVQDGSYLIPATSAWWVFPLVVTLIFVAVQQVDGLIITPKIVGESVGLHPMTVIVSVFAWSLILGGLLGAILAVPMTASLKVLFQRYIWQRALSKSRKPKVEEDAEDAAAASA